MSPKKSKRKSEPKRKMSRPGPSFDRLVAVMSLLRSPNGCPWDREQTHATLRTYLIEETYEVLDALDSTDDAKFAEELGDVLLQVLFHAQIAQEENRFNISDVIREIHDKMVRRHPHVFGNTRAKTSAEVLRNWEAIKSEERAKQKQAKQAAEPSSSSTPSTFSTSATPESLLDGIPHSLPALLEANQLTRRAARIGFDWPNIDGIFCKLIEETQELQAVLASQPINPSRAEGELGDMLFVTVNLARFLNIDPELSLKKSSAKFSRRFRAMEQIARQQGTTLSKIPRAQLESLWDQSKLQEQPPK
jgi:MazG family protein